MSEDALFKKCAWRLVPFVTLLYLVNFIDRVTVGFAALTMNKDLGFSPSVYGFAAGLFFFGYALSQIPANLLLERTGARRGVFFILIVWGAISSANALVRDAASFYAVRFLLGVAESGFFPCMVFYLSSWFPKAYRARFMAAFFAAQPLAFIAGGPLSGAILGLDGVAGLHGWQWLFLIEGVPACILGIVALKVLPDRPADASWLNAAEKEIIARRLAAETVDARRELLPALLDPRVTGLGLALLGQNTAAYGVALWLPQIVQTMGFSNLAIGFVVALPFLATPIASILCGFSSDVKGERVWHYALPILVGAAGFLTASLSPANLFGLAALTIVVVALDTGMGPFWSLPSTFLAGSAAAGGIALIRTIGAFGGFVGPALVGVLVQASGGYASAMVALAGVLVVSALTVLIVGRLIPRFAVAKMPA